jgi:hypothetical protein
MATGSVEEVAEEAVSSASSATVEEAEDTLRRLASTPRIRVYPSHRRLPRERERMSYPHPGSESIRVTDGIHERERERMSYPHPGSESIRVTDGFHERERE